MAMATTTIPTPRCAPARPSPLPGLPGNHQRARLEEHGAGCQPRQTGAAFLIISSAQTCTFQDGGQALRSSLILDLLPYSRVCFLSWAARGDYESYDLNILLHSTRTANWPLPDGVFRR
jgi:hypothetical protein